MGRALNDLEIRQQAGIVDRRGHLAHAAADLGLGGAAGDVGRGGLVALALGALAHGAVEGEGVAGQQNGAVDGLAGQNQIGGAVFDVGVGRIHVGQHVAEELGLEEFLGDLGRNLLQADGELLALLGLGELLGNGLFVEAIAQNLVGDLKGHLVIGGVLRLGAVVGVELFHVHRVRGLGGIGLPGSKVRRGIGVHQRVEDGLGVERALGGAHGDHDILHVLGLRRGRLLALAVFLVAGGLDRFGLGLGGDGGLLEGDVLFLDQIVRRLAQAGLVHGEEVGRVDAVFGIFGLGLGLGLVKDAALAAVVVGGLDRGFQIHLNVALLRRDGQRKGLVLFRVAGGLRGRDGEDHIVFLVLAADGRDGLQRLLLGHAPDVHAPCVNVGIDQPVVFIAVVKQHAGDDHGKPGHGRDDGPGLDAAFLLFLGRRAGGRRSRCPGGGRSGSCSRLGGVSACLKFSFFHVLFPPVVRFTKPGGPASTV